MIRASRKSDPTPRGLRQRPRADGTMRVWWEPRPDDRKHGFEAVDLSDLDPTKARAQVRKLNADADAAAQSGAMPEPRRSSGRKVSDLILLYRQSVEFREGITAKTRVSYTAVLNQIEDKWGTRRAADFDKAVMSTWYDALYYAKGPRMAQSLIRMMSILFSFAELKGWRPENSNPCFRLRIKTPLPRNRAASWDEIESLLTAAATLGYDAAGLAIRLSLFQGQRQTDVIGARRGAFRIVPVLAPGSADARPTWVWFFRRSKRQNDASMPLHPEVIAPLRAALADAGTAAVPRLPGDALLIDEATGHPYDEHLFAKRWARIRLEAAKAPGMAAIATLQFRDLRRTFGVMARAGGASRDDTGDVLGNSSAKDPLLGETYMPPSFHTSSRAIAAVQRPAAGKGTAS